MSVRRAVFIPIVLILALATACGQATPEPTVAPPTDTAGPPTNTPRPSPTPRPTATPNLAATARADTFAALLGDFQDKEYVPAGKGDLFELENFNEEWAQLRWYQWWLYDAVDTDFLYSGHFKWSNASNTPDISGCGVVFGVQSNGDHYAVFLDRSRIAFLMSRGGNTYEVGKTTGSGRVSYELPAEADFALGVTGDKAFVAVDGEYTGYTLSKDQSVYGDFGYSMLSGTNKDYGTRCEISDSMLWMSG